MLAKIEEINKDNFRVGQYTGEWLSTDFRIVCPDKLQIGEYAFRRVVENTFKWKSSRLDFFLVEDSAEFVRAMSIRLMSEKNRFGRKFDSSQYYTVLETDELADHRAEKDFVFLESFAVVMPGSEMWRSESRQTIEFFESPSSVSVLRQRASLERAEDVVTVVVRIPLVARKFVVFGVLGIELEESVAEQLRKIPTASFDFCLLFCDSVCRALATTDIRLTRQLLENVSTMDVIRGDDRLRTALFFDDEMARGGARVFPFDGYVYELAKRLAPLMIAKQRDTRVRMTDDDVEQDSAKLRHYAIQQIELLFLRVYLRYINNVPLEEHYNNPKDFMRLQDYSDQISKLRKIIATRLQ